jgi:hypothetical protein
MTKKMGRPKLEKGKARAKFISTRVSNPEYEEISKAIKRDGIKKPEWVRNALLLKARTCAQKVS